VRWDYRRFFEVGFPNDPAYNMTMSSERITIDSEVCGGRPCIRGMRITVSQVLELLAGGMSREQILKDFPYLESADIDACLQYAAQQASHREIILNK
jgi:uncharacterized protein (DUF433 family)